LIKSLRDLPQEELFVSGHTACPGCGAPIAIRMIMKVLGKKTIVHTPACCLLVFGSTHPYTSWKVPFIHTAFENTGAVISGIRAALEIKGVEDVNVVGIAGDGGTADIGLQALSGAAERNDDVIYICYDNEAYMNTGIQRSGATPYGAWTTTSPPGKEWKVGEDRPKKDVPMIMMAHNVPYVATMSIAKPMDLIRKVEKAKKIKGFRYLHIHSPCQPGWRYDASKTVEIANLAVETGMWILYEFENGKFRITYKPKERKPVEEYLRLQGRFRHLTKEEIEKIQKMVDETWERIEKMEDKSD